MQDLTWPVWPAAILVGAVIWAAAAWPGNEFTSVSEMRTPGLLLVAGGAAMGIIRTTLRRRLIAKSKEQEGQNDKR